MLNSAKYPAILLKSVPAGQGVRGRLTWYLSRRLKLVINEAKSRVCPVHKCVLLGFTFDRTNSAGQTRPSQISNTESGN